MRHRYSFGTTKAQDTKIRKEARKCHDGNLSAAIRDLIDLGYYLKRKKN